MPLVEPMRQPDALQAKRVLKFQSLTALVIVLVGLIFGPSVALSVLIGAGVCLLANAVFVFWVFRGYRAQEPGGLLMRFYGAEIAKIALILALFTLAFVTVAGLSLPALLGAYFVVQVLPTVLATQLDARAIK
ncbi:F0F1-type ATP synthase, subunit I [Thioflavicoccus mobilis 8321]|uniref:F0F1-type ATP synthase, subunit I n=2 Tax=Thioflavicoccus mobilis TaxID=80679 RepID=L0GXE3_9GAMM|nr:F0F1-type ATP synthase, subunit I [Thioflavicoccus mobilis 8321]